MRGKDSTHSALADKIVAVLNHPEMPADLYNRLNATLDDVFGRAGLDYSHPEAQRTHFALMLERLNVSDEQTDDEPQQSNPALPERADDRVGEALNHAEISAVCENVAEFNAAEFYAQILEHPDVSGNTKQALSQVLTEIADECRMNIDNPQILRLAYPLMLSNLSSEYQRGLRNALFSFLECNEDAELIEEIRAKCEAAQMSDEILDSLNARFPDLSPRAKRFSERLVEVCGKAYSQGGYNAMENTLHRVQTALDAAAQGESEAAVVNL